MAGRGLRRRSGAAALWLLLVALLVPLAGCGGRTAADPARAEVQRLLDRRAAALLGHDGGAYDATGTRAGYPDLRAVPLASWSYRVTGLRHTGATGTAEARLSYRIRGYDSAPVTADRTIALSRTADGGWYVDSDRPARQAGQQLWDQGEVAAVTGAHSLVLGVGQTAEQLRGYARLADRAVPAVSGAWGTDWSRQTVVLVPRDLAGMAGLLGSSVSSYRGIAAVTTGEAGGTGKAPADRIVVNPEAYAQLGDTGKQVVLTHETTHVATRAHTTPATPLWLSEGYADWIGYLGEGRTPTQVAPELTRAVRAGRIPAGLPADGDFAFTADPTRLAQAYEGGWLACRMIAERWGEARLGRFYRAVGAHGQRAGAVEDALRQVLGTGAADFTRQWQDDLRSQLS
ncbi:hypothetical protein ACFC09_39195 [Streptomyces sp. NPDC056161]|uniref:hypothetical protein n=1 Tax=Streptomyces sp. NPDC056161 TaxID=3345732 RepID=UPI0035DF89F6